MSQEPWSIQIKANYGTSEQFLVTFNPSKQNQYCNFLERCFTGNAPSITRVSKTYGEEIAKSWIMVQIMDLAEFCGIKEKPDVNTILNLSGIILTNYGYLKVTEFMVFFLKFKSGEYGKFYGIIDNLVITSALHDFMDFRKQIIDKEQRRLNEENRLQIWLDSQKNGITHDEYVKRNKKN